MNPTFTVIRDVSESLKSFIQDNIDEISNPNRVVFDSPAEVNAGGQPRLSLFLYKVRYNKYWRNEPRTRVGVNQIQDKPLIMDLMYLMTPFSNNTETELIVIEKLLSLFYDNTVLRGDQLEGDLIANGNESLRIVPDDLSLDEIEKLWTAFPNRSYRLSIPFIVSPECIPSSRINIVPPVIRKDIEFNLIEDRG